MGKTLAVVGSAIVGAALAVVTGWAIFSSQTAAPSTNPADNNVVQYGPR